MPRERTASFHLLSSCFSWCFCALLSPEFLGNWQQPHSPSCAVCQGTGLAEVAPGQPGRSCRGHVGPRAGQGWPSGTPGLTPRAALLPTEALLCLLPAPQGLSSVERAKKHRQGPVPALEREENQKALESSRSPGWGSGQASPPLSSPGVTGASRDTDGSHIPHSQRGTRTASPGCVTLLICSVFLGKRMDSMTNKQH